MNFSLKRISLQNFRAVHDRLDLDFKRVPTGLYFVRGYNEVQTRLGANGAGKSTLFIESFYWALTGKISRSARPGDSIVNRQNLKGLVEVEIEFGLDDKDYIVCRTRNPNSLTLNSKTIEQRDIDSLLPITDSALRRSILIDQFGEMFLSLPPEKKSQLFSEALNLDLWIAASDKASKKASEVDKQLDKTQVSLDAAVELIAEARSEIATITKAEEGFEAEIQGQIREKKQELRAANTKVEEATEELDKARSALAKVGKTDLVIKLNSMKTNRRKMQEAVGNCISYLASANRELERLRKQLDSYKTDSKVCPECGQKVSSAHIKEKRDQVKASILDFTERRERALINKENLEGEFEKLDKEIEKLQEIVADGTAKQDIVSTKAELSIAATKAVNRIKDEITDLSARENPYTAQLDRLKKRLTELRKNKSQYEEDKEKAERLLAIYKFWQDGFKEIRLQQIDVTLAELELVSNRHAESLGLEGWHIEFATEREKKTGGMSNSFSVFLYEPDNSDPVNWDTYSGGESQRWQLAATFGIAEVLLARSGITTDFEVLDEPTQHLSPEGVDDLLDCLRNRAVDLGRRVFIIDHHALDRGAFDGILSVVKDSKGIHLEDYGIANLLSPAKENKSTVLVKQQMARVRLAD